jgi:hypothetical protein
MHNCHNGRRRRVYTFGRSRDAIVALTNQAPTSSTQFIGKPLSMRILRILTVCVAAASIAACTTMAPIHNVSNAPVTSASGKALTEDQIKGAIIRAGASLGWQMREIAPGRLGASIALRKHTAEIEIPYSTKQYSIVYKSSTNLDEKGGQIHKNYNGWIQNLTRGINAQLSAS